MYVVPDNIKEIARDLRKKQTKAEKLLWERIKNKKLWVRFLRQRPVCIITDLNWISRFSIPDFYCKELGLIIEVDWCIHNIPEILGLDKVKEGLLKQRWLHVMRIENEAIYSDIEKAVDMIRWCIKII